MKEKVGRSSVLLDADMYKDLLQWWQMSNAVSEHHEGFKKCKAYMSHIGYSNTEITYISSCKHMHTYSKQFYTF